VEKESYTPEEVLQTEGPNKGNIKDEDLSRIGAEAEEHERSKVSNKISRVMEPFMGGSNADYYADDSGEKAMKREVSRRARKDLKDKGVSPGGLAAGGSRAAHNFDVAQAEYTKDRVAEEVNTHLKDTGKRKETY
jgi:hypothetical protein